MNHFGSALFPFYAYLLYLLMSFSCGLIRIPIVTKSLAEIKEFYADLSPNIIQYCSDETFNEAKEEENIKLALQR